MKVKVIKRYNDVVLNKIKEKDENESEKQQCKKYRTCGGNYDTCYIDSVHSACFE